MDQPRQYGAEDPAVASRLLRLLQELAWCDPAGTHRKKVREHLARIRDAVNAGDQPAGERRRVLELVDPIESTPPMD
jgi:hypothetical protein